MDYSPIVNEALKVLWWLVPAALVIGVLRSPWSGRYLVSSMRLRVIGCWLGSISLLVAVPSALLASAPFTPAVFTVGVTVPSGACAALMGAWRTGCLAVYWGLAAVVALPHVLPDFALLLAYTIGVVAAGVLFFNYRYCRPADRASYARHGR